MTREELEPYMLPLHPDPPSAEEHSRFSKEMEVWNWMRKQPEFESAESLAYWFSEEPYLFEEETEEGTTADEEIVILGITQFYHERVGFVGHEEEAWRVFRAFQMSECIKEVRLLVLKVAATLHLGAAYRSR